METPLDIPSFLRQPKALSARVLGDGESALSFQCNDSDWYVLNLEIREFWWSFRYIRAYAFAGDLGGVLRHEAELEEGREEIVAQLARFGGAEADTRAWLIPTAS
jgi:hypothetical protein